MKIPLTIKHTELDKPFFIMPEAQLLSLTKLEHNKMLKELIRVRDDWIENKRCKCAENPNIQNKKISLSCKHIKSKKANNKIIQETNKKIERMTSAIIIRRMGKHFLKGHSEEQDGK